MKKIEIFEGCTSNFIRIDGKDTNDIPVDIIKDYIKSYVDTL